MQEIEILSYYQMVYVLKNKTHKILWDFEIQADHLIPTRRPDLVMINKKKKKKTCCCYIVNFTIPANCTVKIKENKKRDKYLNFAQELRKLLNMSVTVIPTVIDMLGTVSKGLEVGLEDLEIGVMNQDHPNYNIIEIDQNTE